MTEQLVRRQLIILVLVIALLGQMTYVPSLFADSANILVKVAFESPGMPPEKITDLVAERNFTIGASPTSGGQVSLTWTAPKDLPNNTTSFSYVIKYSKDAPSGWPSPSESQIWEWWNSPQTITCLENHFWWLPEQVQGQTFTQYPAGFGIPAPEEKYNLGYGITDKIVITGLEKGELYYFGVSARDRYYHLSTAAVSSSYVPGASIPPGKVTDLRAVGIDDYTAKLNWSAPGNDEYQYKIPDGRYFIAYSTVVPGGNWQNWTPVNVTSLWTGSKSILISTSTFPGEQHQVTITGLQFLQNGTTIAYYFLVWTSDEWSNKSNWSEISNLSKAGLGVPDPVQIKSITHLASTDISSGSYVVLEWTNPEDPNTSIKEVRIYWSTNTWTKNENYITVIATIPGKTYQYSHLQLTPGKDYFYAVFARNIVGEWPEIIGGVNAAEKTYVYKDLIPPEQVTNLAGIPGAIPDQYAFINLNWTLPSTTVYQNLDLDHIEINKSTDSLNWTDVVSNLSKNSTYYTITGLESFTTYYLQVITCDTTYYGKLYPNKSTATLSVYIPYDYGRPNKITIRSFTISCSSDPSIGSYVIFYASNPADTDIAGLKVYYSSISASGKENLRIVTEYTGSNETYSVIISTLFPRTTYYFTFLVYDKAGLESVEVSHSTFTYLDILSPDPVDNLVATADANLLFGCYAVLNWTHPDPNRTKYQNYDFSGIGIKISTISFNGPYLRDIQGLPVRQTSYGPETLSNLTPQTTYYFVVYTYDQNSPPNISTRTVSVYTRKDIVSPRIIPSLTVSTTWYNNIDDGCVLTVNWTYPEDVDLDKFYVALREERQPRTSDDAFQENRKNFIAIPGGTGTTEFKGLIGNTTYYLSVFLYDWSGNMSSTTISGIVINIPRDRIVPFIPLGLSPSKSKNTFSINWSKTEYQNEIDNIFKISGITKPTPKATELYRYLIYESDDLTDWELKAIKKPTDITSWSVEMSPQTKFYKIRSVDICGNYNDSMIVDNSDELNVYCLNSDGSFFRMNKEVYSVVGDKFFVWNRVYDQEKGPIFKSYSIEPYRISQGKPEYVTDFNFGQPKVELGIKYDENTISSRGPQVSKALAEPEKWLSLFYFNGKEWLKLASSVNTNTKKVSTTVKYLGSYQLRYAMNVTEFTYYEVMPKIITPNNDGQNDRAFFRFENPKSRNIEIKIFDLTGALVKKLNKTDDSSTTPGAYTYWDGTDQNGKVVPPGTYIYQLEAEGKVYNGTIIVAR